MSRSQFWMNLLLLPIKTLCSTHIGNNFRTFTFNLHVCVLPQIFQESFKYMNEVQCILSSLLFCSRDSATNVFFPLQNYKSRLFSAVYLRSELIKWNSRQDGIKNLLPESVKDKHCWATQQRENISIVTKRGRGREEQKFFTEKRRL